MIAAAVLAMVVAGTAPGATLDVTSVDASAYPSVVIDFVLPEPYAAVDLTPAMISVDGAPVESVAPVDPGSVVVRLVVDDRPSVPPNVVGASQGGAVELVRNTGAGTRIAVGTPSGLQTAATADPGAAIAGIAAITAGAPAVVPMPALILDSAAALAADEFTDRHLVVALGEPLQASEAELAQIADVVAANGITLHLLSAAGQSSPELTLVAEQSGGTAAESAGSLVFFDTVTAAISNRYRISTTVTAPGEHVVGLTIDGPPITALVAVELPAVASNSPAPATPSPTTPEAPVVVAGAAPTTAVVGADEAEAPVVAGAAPTTAVVGADDADRATASDGATASDDTAASDDAGESPSRLIAVAMVVLAAVLLNAVAVYWHRRRSRRLEAEAARAQAKPARAETGARPAVAAEPVVHDEANAVAGVSVDELTARRTARQKPVSATQGDTAFGAIAVAELKGDATSTKPARPPRPKPQRAQRPKPAIEEAATAEPGAAKEPVWKSKPTPTPKPTPKSKPTLEAVSAAAATDSDVAEEAAPKPKPKRTPKPKPHSEPSTEQEHDRTRMSELVSEPTSREPAERRPTT